MKKEEAIVLLNRYMIDTGRAIPVKPELFERDIGYHNSRKFWTFMFKEMHECREQRWEAPIKVYIPWDGESEVFERDLTH